MGVIPVKGHSWVEVICDGGRLADHCESRSAVTTVTVGAECGTGKA